MHTALKKQYKAHYVSGNDEGEYGYLCLKFKDNYLAINTSDYGTGADYSKVAPACLKCSTISKDAGKFVSGTGLSLGQSRTKVSQLLNKPINSNVVDLTYEETESGDNGDVLHTEILRLEFKNGLLIRYSILDYREGA
jgi:hypothetical protein